MMFGDLPAATRLQMELVARASDSPEAALADVVSIIVETGGTKCTAIVQAFTDNDSLREQWERTWEVLRR